MPWPIDFNSMASGVQQHCDEVQRFEFRRFAGAYPVASWQDRQQVRAKAAEEACMRFVPVVVGHVVSIDVDCMPAGSMSARMVGCPTQQ